MNGYDLDGVLARVNFDQASTRGLRNVYLQADVIYSPRSEFVVLTGRNAGTAELRKVTRDWLRDKFGEKFQGVFFYGGGEAAVARAKARAINRLGLDSYTDDNLDILRMIKEAGVSVPLYHFSGGEKKRI